MNLTQFQVELQKLMYIEDPNMVSVVLGSIVANSLQVGDPVWLTLIGPSSGGKSQLIRPFAMAHSEYIHRIDDMTANTMLSGSLGYDNSLLGRIGKAGMLSMDDLTVLFSKNADQRSEILSQFRMIYDGRFAKSSGARKEDILWEGYIGMIAGSTPSIYRYFSEVADMGERFISYRMKKIDVHKAVEFVSCNPKTSRELNNEIADLIRSYLPTLLSIGSQPIPKLHEHTIAAIQEASECFTLLRTPLHTDDRSGLVDEFPEPEMPFRVMKQLTYLAVGMQCLLDDPNQPLPEDMVTALQWTAYSLADDKRRAYMSAVCALEYQGMKITTRNISAATGLHNDVVTRGLAHLQALGIITLAFEDGTRREFSINNRQMYRLVRKLDPVVINESDVTEL